MQDPAKFQEQWSELAGKTIETMTLWAETNQRLLREMVDLGTGVAREGLHLYAELSRSAIEAVKDGQAGMLRWQASWRELQSDPGAWYQKAVGESVQGAQQTVRRAEENAQVWTRSAERLQVTTEQAGRNIQESLAGAASRLKEIYASNSGS